MAAENTTRPLREIAICTKCARGFVWVPPGYDMIDRYPDARSWVRAGQRAGTPCGGQIEMKETADAQ